MRRGRKRVAAPGSAPAMPLPFPSSPGGAAPGPGRAPRHGCASRRAPAAAAAASVLNGHGAPYPPLQPPAAASLPSTSLTSPWAAHAGISPQRLLLGWGSVSDGASGIASSVPRRRAPGAPRGRPGFSHRNRPSTRTPWGSDAGAPVGAMRGRFTARQPLAVDVLQEALDGPHELFKAFHMVAQGAPHRIADVLLLGILLNERLQERRLHARSRAYEAQRAQM